MPWTVCWSHSRKVLTCLMTETDTTSKNQRTDYFLKQRLLSLSSSRIKQLEKIAKFWRESMFTKIFAIASPPYPSLLFVLHMTIIAHRPFILRNAHFCSPFSGFTQLALVSMCTINTDQSLFLCSCLRVHVGSLWLHRDCDLHQFHQKLVNIILCWSVGSILIREVSLQTCNIVVIF